MATSVECQGEESANFTAGSETAVWSILWKRILNGDDTSSLGREAPEGRRPGGEALPTESIGVDPAGSRSASQNTCASWNWKIGIAGGIWPSRSARKNIAYGRTPRRGRDPEQRRCPLVAISASRQTPAGSCPDTRQRDWSPGHRNRGADHIDHAWRAFRSDSGYRRRHEGPLRRQSAQCRDRSAGAIGTARQ